MNKVAITPPSALEMEEAVLGALILERDAYLEVETLLCPDVFYKDAHQLIYAAIQKLHERNHPVDILTVRQELESSGDLENAGGAYGITQLASRMSSSANISYHAHIIFEQYLKRRVIALAADAQKEAYDEGSDALDLITSLSNRAEALADISSTNDEIKELTDNLVESLRHIESTKNTSGVTGVPTGYASLDRITSGWQKGELIVVGARPSMGKSAFVLQEALNAAEHGVAVAFFSLEMTRLQLVKRMQSNYSEIDSDKIKRNDLSSEDWGALTDASDRLSRHKIYIDDSPGLKVRNIKSKSRKLKRQGKLGMIIIDYLQLVDGTEGTSNKNGIREQEIAFISRSAKNLAKELDVPVILLSQLSREVEKRGGQKEPSLGDLRESGAIEQDADIVLFLHRPEYYGITETEDGMSTQGMTKIIFAKYRDGSPCRTVLRFVGSISKFVEWEAVRYEAPPEQEFPAGSRLVPLSQEEDDIPF